MTPQFTLRRLLIGVTLFCALLAAWENLTLEFKFTNHHCTFADETRIDFALKWRGLGFIDFTRRSDVAGIYVWTPIRGPKHFAVWWNEDGIESHQTVWR